MLFAGLAALLAVAAGVGISGGGSPIGDNIGGSIFFAALLLVCLGVSGFRQSVEFEARPASIRFRSSIFGIPLGRKSIEKDAELALVVRELRMLDPESAAPRNKAIQGFLERRAAIYRLYVENEQGVHYIAESSDGEDLKEVGKSVADFLGIPYRTERL